MLTGELRSQIDAIWNAFWSSGISNPLEVMEQITYLLFPAVRLVQALRRSLDSHPDLHQNQFGRHRSCLILRHESRRLEP
jgi:hypothetical protein